MDISNHEHHKNETHIMDYPGRHRWNILQSFQEEKEDEPLTAHQTMKRNWVFISQILFMNTDMVDKTDLNSQASWSQNQDLPHQMSLTSKLFNFLSPQQVSFIII